MRNQEKDLLLLTEIRGKLVSLKGDALLAAVIRIEKSLDEHTNQDIEALIAGLSSELVESIHYGNEDLDEQEIVSTALKEISELEERILNPKL